MKLTDPLVKRRVFIASLYREVDILLQGSVKHVQFQKIYDALVDKDYINPKKYKFEDVIKRVDPTNKTKVEMNRFVAWMNEVNSTFNIFLCIVCLLLISLFFHYLYFAACFHSYNFQFM